MALKPATLQWSDEGKLLNLDYDDIYFQPQQGREESYYVFLEKNNLPLRFKNMDRPCFRIAELGFGSGLNFFLTVDLFLKTAPVGKRLSYVSFEKHPIPKTDLEKIYRHTDLDKTIIHAFLSHYPPMIEGFHHITMADHRVDLILCFGDVKDLLPETIGTFDAWYLDGFAPTKNPDMWDDTLFPMMAKRTNVNGTLSTFSAASTVRRGLENAGFTVTKEKGFGKKRDMLTAHREAQQHAIPIPKSNTDKITATVLGGGLAGCNAAYALARRGITTTLVERRQNVAQETSGNPVAILYPKLTLKPTISGGFGALHQHGFLWTRHLIEKLNLKTWHPCGVLHLDMDDTDKERNDKIIQTHGYPLDYAQSKDHGLWQGTSGYLSPVEFCQKLITAHPVRKVFATEITKLNHTNNQWHGYTDDDTLIFKSDILVIADGLNVSKHAQTSWMTLTPLRGQMTAVKPTEQSKILNHVICPDGYITPVMNDRHYIGATFSIEPPDDNNTDPQTRPSDDIENVTNIQNHCPDLRITTDHILQSRAGYRATTVDKMPVIGACPKYDDYVRDFAGLRKGQRTSHIEKPLYEGLYVSTGFGAHGLISASLAGEIIACMVTNEPIPAPHSLIKAMMPERFIIRDLKRNKI